MAAEIARTKRKRTVSQHPGFDYCRSCRSRKLRCDGRRPSCRRCTTAGLVCGGYAIWEVQLDQPEQATPDLTVSTTVNGSAMYRSQLLADFANRYHATRVLAAPSSAHIQSWSFLHHLIQSSAAPDCPMLSIALETLCLSHLAAQSPEPRSVQLPLQESYTRLLSSLRTAITLSNRTSGRSTGDQHHHNHLNRRDIVATIVALSLMPTTTDDDAAHPNQRGLHLLGAEEFLRMCGPSILEVGEHFDLSLLRHVHLYSTYHAFAKRKALCWVQPGWREVQQLFVDPPPKFPAVARFVPGHEAEDGFLLYSFSSRESMENFVHPLPGLLERSDAFAAQSQLDASSDEQIADYVDLVRSLDDLQGQLQSHRPVTEQDSNFVPELIRTVDASVLDFGIEEHVFLYNSPSVFAEQYRFVRVEQGFNTVFFHQLYLIADCALLHVMYCGLKSGGEERFGAAAAADAGVNVDMGRVERRAYWHASELVRCTHFYSQRTLTAARFLSSVLSCARNFFESYGAIQEMEWCQGCLLATEIRTRRLSLTASNRTLCRFVDVAADLPSGCRYGPQWTGVVETT